MQKKNKNMSGGYKRRSAKGQAEEHLDRVRESRTGEFINTLLEFFKNHPGLSVPGAGGIGCIPGRLLRH